MKSFEGIFCQRCSALNPPGRELCAHCNTRLMLVVETPASRHESGAASPEEFMLERVSGIENKIVRIVEQIERLLDVMLKQTNRSFDSQLALEALIATLVEARVITREHYERIHAQFRAKVDERRAEAETENAQRASIGGYESLRQRFIEGYRGDAGAEFAKLIADAIAAFDVQNLTRAVSKLERAAALAPNHHALNFFLGAYFFQEGKSALARDYLLRAAVAEGEIEKSGARKKRRGARFADVSVRLQILLGIALGDEGEIEEAKTLLGLSTKRADSFAARYALGRLAAVEGDWREALRQFRRASASLDCAESDYLVGLAALHLNRVSLAVKFLARAVERDGNFASAHFLLGVALAQQGKSESALESLKAAVAAASDQKIAARFRSSLSALRRRGVMPELPEGFNAFALESAPASERMKRARRHLLTGGDARLAKLLREEALRVSADAAQSVNSESAESDD